LPESKQLWALNASLARGVLFSLNNSKRRKFDVQARFVVDVVGACTSGGMCARADGDANANSRAAEGNPSAADEHTRSADGDAGSTHRDARADQSRRG